VTNFFLIAATTGILLLTQAGASENAEPLCVILESAAERQSYRARAGDLLRVAFNHSIYGSRVEERFQIKDDSFESVDVRYAERRLVEFYGFESALRIGDSWVARPARRHYEALTLRASQDSRIAISFRDHVFSFSDGVARLSLGRCQHPIHG